MDEIKVIHEEMFSNLTSPSALFPSKMGSGRMLYEEPAYERIPYKPKSN